MIRVKQNPHISADVQVLIQSVLPKRICFQDSVQGTTTSHASYIMLLIHRENTHSFFFLHSLSFFFCIITFIFPLGESHTPLWTLPGHYPLITNLTGWIFSVYISITIIVRALPSMSHILCQITFYSSTCVIFLQLMADCSKHSWFKCSISPPVSYSPHAIASKKASSGRQFFPSTSCVPWVELRFPGLVTSTFTH